LRSFTFYYLIGAISLAPGEIEPASLRLGHVTQISAIVRISARGQGTVLRPVSGSEPELSIDLISLPLLKNGTALLSTETRARCEDYAQSGPLAALQKRSEPPQFDAITTRHCGGNLRKNNIDDLLGMLPIEMRVLGRYSVDKF
jgi:hypothetical protein